MKTILMPMLALLLCSCHVKQETDIEINPRPALRLSYKYLNDNGTNTIYDEVRKLNITVLNEQGETVSTADILKNQMGDYRPLYGVPEGEYTVVTFGNADSTMLTGGYALLHPDKTHASADELFHKIERYYVKRGAATLHTVSLEKLYYAMTLRVVGLRGLDGKSVTDFSVSIDGTPSGFTHEGTQLKPMSVVPRLKQVADTTFASFNVHKFDNAANVTLTLKHKAETLVRFPLSNYLRDNQSGIDLLNSKDITIPIELDISTVGVGITINDWHATTLQWSNVGQ